MSQPAPTHQISQLQQTSPNILFIISRSKNHNIVVYEANLKDGQLDQHEPVLVYWLDIDPEYVKKSRAKGITSDRVELNLIEKQFAYGLSAHPDGPNRFKITLVALKERPLHVWLDAEGKLAWSIEINGKEAKLLKVYINSTDRMLGLPKVNYVEIHGLDADGKEVSEKIVPK